MGLFPTVSSDGHLVKEYLLTGLGLGLINSPEVKMDANTSLACALRNFITKAVKNGFI